MVKLSRLSALVLSLALGTAALTLAAPAPSPEKALLRCPRFFCPVTPEGECLCEWVLCPDGNYYCGRP
jgi:hypothetical protein